MELKTLPRLLGLNELEAELLTGFLGFREENKTRISHLVRMEPDRIVEPLRSLVERSLVLERERDGELCYSLTDDERLIELATANRDLTEGELARLTREGRIIAEVRELSELRFINVVAIRERVGDPAPPEQVSRYMRHYYPNIDLRLGTRCNFNCMYCLLGHEKKFLREMDEIEKDLELGRKCGLRKVALTGGEPTLHPRLIKIIRLCRELEYDKITLVSNAALLAEERNIDRITGAGVDTFGFSFDVADREISERLWRKPAYDAVVQGAKNLLARDGLVVSSIAVITRQNYRLLPELASFLAELSRDSKSIFSANVDFVMPEENAWRHREAIVPRLSDVVPYVREALSGARDLGLLLTYRGIPACVLGDDFLDRDLDRFMSIFQMHETQEGTRFNRSSLDLYRTKPSSCRLCRYDRSCLGVYRGYAHLFGTDELKPITEGR